MLTVGEMSSTSLENCIRYTNPKERELKMAFSFHHLKVDYRNGDKWALMAPDYAELTRLFRTWQEGMQDAGGWNAVFWCNHDQPRILSRMGDEGQYRKESAKMLATLIHMMRGTPYIYQGEEIGMTNAGYTSIDQYRDVESTNYFAILRAEGKSEEEALHIIGERSRDNGRTPMQWDASEFAGFTAGESWLGIPANHSYINVESEEKDDDSILAYYKKLVQLRKEHEIIADGDIRFLETGTDDVIAYERTLGDEKLTVYCNLRGHEVPFADLVKGEILITNYAAEELKDNALKPYEARVAVS
jgi:trehalose-6-phosphate hydrolase